MGEMVHWAQNCLRIFKLSKSVNGKGIHSGPIFQSHFHPQEEYGFENPSQGSTIHRKYSEMSADVPNHSLHAGKKRSCQWLHSKPLSQLGPTA